MRGRSRGRQPARGGRTQTTPATIRRITTVSSSSDDEEQQQAQPQQTPQVPTNIQPTTTTQPVQQVQLMDIMNSQPEVRTAPRTTPRTVPRSSSVAPRPRTERPENPNPRVLFNNDLGAWAPDQEENYVIVDDRNEEEDVPEVNTEQVEQQLDIVTTKLSTHYKAYTWATTGNTSIVLICAYIIRNKMYNKWDNVASAIRNPEVITQLKSEGAKLPDYFRNLADEFIFKRHGGTNQTTVNANASDFVEFMHMIIAPFNSSLVQQGVRTNLPMYTPLEEVAVLDSDLDSKLVQAFWSFVYGIWDNYLKFVDQTDKAPPSWLATNSNSSPISWWNFILSGFVDLFQTHTSPKLIDVLDSFAKFIVSSKKVPAESLLDVVLRLKVSDTVTRTQITQEDRNNAGNMFIQEMAATLAGVDSRTSATDLVSTLDNYMVVLHTLILLFKSFIGEGSIKELKTKEVEITRLNPSLYSPKIIYIYSTELIEISRFDENRHKVIELTWAAIARLLGSELYTDFLGISEGIEPSVVKTRIMDQESGNVYYRLGIVMLSTLPVYNNEDPTRSFVNRLSANPQVEPDNATEILTRMYSSILNEKNPAESEEFRYFLSAILNPNSLGNLFTPEHQGELEEYADEIIGYVRLLNTTPIGEIIADMLTSSRNIRGEHYELSHEFQTYTDEFTSENDNCIRVRELSDIEEDTRRAIPGNKESVLLLGTVDVISPESILLRYSGGLSSHAFVNAFVSYTYFVVNYLNENNHINDSDEAWNALFNVFKSRVKKSGSDGIIGGLVDFLLDSEDYGNEFALASGDLLVQKFFELKALFESALTNPGFSSFASLSRSLEFFLALADFADVYSKLNTHTQNIIELKPVTAVSELLAPKIFNDIYRWIEFSLNRRARLVASKSLGFNFRESLNPDQEDATQNSTTLM